MTELSDMRVLQDLSIQPPDASFHEDLTLFDSLKNLHRVLPYLLSQSLLPPASVDTLQLPHYFSIPIHSVDSTALLSIHASGDLDPFRQRDHGRATLV